MTMSASEVRAEMDREPQRHHQFAYADGNDFVSELGGREYRAGNPFGLDSKLTSAGMPTPSTIYLVNRADIAALEATREEQL